MIKVGESFKFCVNKENSVEFDNGMKKSNPWNNIMNFNRYYEKKYGICII